MSGKVVQFQNDLTKGPLRKKTICFLLQKYGDTCFYCGQPLGDDITIEHLLSKSRVGQRSADHIDNLALAHQRCNSSAANMSLYDKIKMRESEQEMVAMRYLEQEERSR